MRYVHGWYAHAIPGFKEPNLTVWLEDPKKIWYKPTGTAGTAVLILERPVLGFRDLHVEFGLRSPCMVPMSASQIHVIILPSTQIQSMFPKSPLRFVL